VVVGLAEGGLMGVVYALAGVPHAALMALLTGLVSVIPMGATLAALLAAGILAALGSPLAGAVVAVVGVVGIFIADHFVRPVMIGDATRLPFVWVLLGILGGVEVWGLIGLVLGPALIAALMLLWREFIGAQAGRSTLRRIEKRKREEVPPRAPQIAFVACDRRCARLPRRRLQQPCSLRRIGLHQIPHHAARGIGGGHFHMFVEAMFARAAGFSQPAGTP
jgi:hypothetical protein